MFNEESVLYIADPGFVGQLDRELFAGRLALSRKAHVADLQALIEVRGGAWHLIREKVKGLLT